MSILEEIRKDAIDSSVDITNALRKTMDLAFRLNNTEIKLWAENELNGYRKLSELPDYRKLHVQSYGYFSGFWQSHIDNQPIPPSAVPEKYREYISNAYLQQPISYYIDLLNGTEGKLAEKWDHDLIVAVQDEIIENYNLRDAWKLIPKGSIAALIDSVRNRLLTFVLKLINELKISEDVNPQDLEAKNKQITQTFNTIVLGNVDKLSVSPEINIYQVNKGDEESLVKYLLHIGILEDDIDALKAALQSDKEGTAEIKFGNSVSQWLTKMLSKAANGTLKIGFEAAGNLLAMALSKYLGIA